MLIQILKKILAVIICCAISLATNAQTTTPIQPPTAPQNLQPITIVLDWFINPNHAPLFVAQQQGFFKQQGLDVKFVPPADPSDPPKLVAAGKADLAISYQPDLMLQVAQELPVIRIATLINSPLDTLAVNGDSLIHKIEDLKGKKIGYSTDGVHDAALIAMLTQHGLTLNDVQLVNVKYDLTQALLSHQVDAVIGVMRNFEIIEMQLAGHPARTFNVEDNGMPAYDELIIIANQNQVNDPRFPRFITALAQGAQYLKQHPEDTWQQFAANHPELNNDLNHQAWYASLPYFALNPGLLDTNRYQTLAQFMQKYNLIKSIPPIGNYAVQLTK